ncbi:hypothetical protein SVA_0249 [Sulfurifustis variabilis]|uniref:Uncharacterized protein n=1 Tax=Sulfurifustis variabilis TaxID=1675686 RepID=A0A1B4VAB3_9GAMM|nr:hypothetical protein SVA_0249 [Sulfurifustis variabilis]
MAGPLARPGTLANSPGAEKRASGSNISRVTLPGQAPVLGDLNGVFNCHPPPPDGERLL